MSRDKFKLVTQSSSEEHDLFTRANQPSRDIVRKIIHRTINSGVYSEVCRILSLGLWNENFKYEDHFECDRFMTHLFSYGCESRFIYDIIERYKQMNDIDDKIDFYVKLIIRQIAMTSYRHNDESSVIEFIRECPGFNDNIDYKYYISDYMPDHADGSWRSILKNIAFRSYTLSKWFYYTTSLDMCILIDYVSFRYAVNEVAKAVAAFTIESPSFNIYDRTYMKILNDDECKIIKKFFDAVEVAYENIKHEFAVESSTAEWRSMIQHRIEKLESNK